ncbi:bifunctional adenosylcobinamide kinase/adenosylcobinamide-phosphate guanylyltransferase [Facklamia sp. DSM 111018]|uniref:Adenosylcobinamide kinase n=1 Tax=Facklamia lactis TaxID=2749967 RepID=A0ABS0LPE1_9LACT|nr:bifunctional adenosylcobinamide kinase/adenosylcobinamide-phosphate guanylyltransferase [Facklamia lactis]MBG9980112.1 bifunctional adenosylcobinamide kinase/adenosylcobinamide-phosphate guanylyltransferase [Facklamia lactis]MBG9985914.1 bifunctional adenosylcobinamide kinase/adenosylcobinamide-phosphate guanylyltransferase [Facklamia lactis]
MGQLIYITGGAKSGKSSFAEQDIMNSQKEPIAYIATQAREFGDEEMERSIKLHQQSRPKEWTTFEQYQSLDQLIIEIEKSYQGILIDCATVWVTNILFDYWKANANSSGQEVEQYIDHLTMSEISASEQFLKNELFKLLKAVGNSDISVWIVSNEVGSGIVPNNKLARIFRNLQGIVNQELAREAEQVYWLISGIPMKIKGGEALGE